MKFSFLIAALALTSVDAQAAPAQKAAPAKKAAAAKKAAPAAKRAAPAAKKAAPAAAKSTGRRVHSKKFNNVRPKDTRGTIKKARIGYDDDNSKYVQPPPSLPKTFGLDEGRNNMKSTDHRIIEKEASKKTGRIPQFPHDISRTSHRETFKRSDQDRRAINVQEMCAGYANEG